MRRQKQAAPHNRHTTDRDASDHGAIGSRLFHRRDLLHDDDVESHERVLECSESEDAPVFEDEIRHWIDFDPPSINDDMGQNDIEC